MVLNIDTGSFTSIDNYYIHKAYNISRNTMCRRNILKINMLSKINEKYIIPVNISIF